MIHDVSAHGEALFSDDRTHRFLLERQVGRCSALGGGDFDPVTSKPRPLRCALDFGHAGSHNALGPWCPGVAGHEHLLGPVFVVVGLNPSTATGAVDDPTMRRCIAFARSNGCNVFLMLNLFSLVSTDPNGLLVPVEGGVGRRLSDDANRVENDLTIERALRRIPALGGRLVFAWGNTFSRLTAQRVDWLWGTARDFGLVPVSFGTTKDGAPRHPLYLRGDASLRPWTP